MLCLTFWNESRFEIKFGQSVQNILPVGKIFALNLCKAFHHPLIEMVVEVNWGNHPIYLRRSGLTFYFHLLPKYKATQVFCDALKKTQEMIREDSDKVIDHYLNWTFTVSFII